MLVTNDEDDDLLDVEEEDVEEEGEGEEQISLLYRPPPTKCNNSFFLPTEIISLIINQIPSHAQSTFYACCLISVQWYYESAKLLYRRPRLTAKNFPAFARTLTSTSDRRTSASLASLVEYLDLSHTVHSGSSSTTARLLRRTAPSLTTFIAPQASFGISCVSALGNLHKLDHLDLSLVAHAVKLRELFAQLRGLPQLKSLDFPRSGTLEPRKGEMQEVVWPSGIERISLAGSIPADKLWADDAGVPKSLVHLKMAHFPTESAQRVLRVISKIGHQLRRLSVSYRIPKLGNRGLDYVLVAAPKLESLHIAVDYISPLFFSGLDGVTFPLRRLELDTTGDLKMHEKICPDDVFDAVADGSFSKLRVVRVSSRLGWYRNYRTDVRMLANLLESLAEENGEDPNAAGVWEIESEKMNVGGFGGYS